MTIRRRYEQVRDQEYYPSDAWWAVVQTSNTDLSTLLELMDEVKTIIGADTGYEEMGLELDAWIQKMEKVVG